MRAVLWDADGVLQRTPVEAWQLAVQVVAQFPGALTGAAIDEPRIRTAAHELGLGDRVDDILAVWSTFDVSEAILEVIASVRAGGTACYLATNQDAHRAAGMRERAPYRHVLDGMFYSCDIGAAKPSSGFFEHVVADLALAPGQLLFIDDQPANVDGARSAGLAAECWTHDDGVVRLRGILDAHHVRLGPGRPARRGADHPTGGKRTGPR